MTLCECGCGQEVKPGNRFIHGHNGRGEPRTPETCAILSKVMKNSEAYKASVDKRRGIPLPPEWCAAVSKGIRNSEAVKAVNEAKRGVPLSPETCAAVRLGLIEYWSDQANRDEQSERITNSAAAKAAAEAQRGVPLPPERCAAISEGLKNSDAVKDVAAAKQGVPLSPEHIVAMKKGQEESGMFDRQRGGNDIIRHHHIYDHGDLSKYTIEMTRSQHMSLHQNMKFLGLKVPHINTGHENVEELELMEYINKIGEAE